MPSNELKEWTTWGAREILKEFATPIAGGLVTLAGSLLAPMPWWVRGAIVAAVVILLLGIMLARELLRRKKIEEDTAASRVELQAQAADAEKRLAQFKEQLPPEIRDWSMIGSQWHAQRALGTDLFYYANFAASAFGEANVYGAVLEPYALMVLKDDCTEISVIIRLVNYAPFKVVPQGMRVKGSILGLSGLNLEIDEPKVEHAYISLSPGQKDNVTVRIRKPALSGRIPDSAIAAIVGRVLVRSEYWSDTQEAGIDTRAWGIVVDKRTPPPQRAGFPVLSAPAKPRIL